MSSTLVSFHLDHAAALTYITEKVWQIALAHVRLTPQFV